MATPSATSTIHKGVSVTAVGRSLLTLQRFEEAEPFLREALSIREEK